MGKLVSDIPIKLALKKDIEKIPIQKINSGKMKPKTSTTILPCQVIVLEDINVLARKFRGKVNLSLKPIKKRGTVEPSVNQQLIRWEVELNKICIKDPVLAVENFVDDEGPPKDFLYVRENINNSESLALLDPSFLVGCECFPRCSNKMCDCPKNGGGHFAYDRNKRVLLPKGSPIYECNQKCKCSSDCPNRVIQKGLTTRVCIFRTPDGRGWGLKTREFIPKNKFVVEYVGEIITTEEAEKRGKDYDTRQQTYLFDLDFNDEDATFTVDAYRYGNVSHFINHSCEPNLQVYSVWVDSLDPQLPRIGLFATRDINAGEELTFDYMMFKCDENETGHSPAYKTKHGRQLKQENDEFETRVFCACGAKSCRKYLF